MINSEPKFGKTVIIINNKTTHVSLTLLPSVPIGHRTWWS